MISAGKVEDEGRVIEAGWDVGVDSIIVAISARIDSIGGIVEDAWSRNDIDDDSSDLLKVICWLKLNGES